MSYAMLIVDEKNLFRKETFGNAIGIDDIQVTDDINEVERLLHKDVNGSVPFNMLVISTVFVDKMVKEQKLLDILGSFQGSIIVRVDDEASGLDLIKRNIATDYFISDNNETENLKKAVNNAAIRSRFIERLARMHNDIKTLEVIHQTMAKK